MVSLQPGDIAACYGTDRESKVIRCGTASIFGPRRLVFGPSHVAVIAEHRGIPIWIESTTLCNHPCVITDLHVAGCQAHLPEMRIADYVGGGGRVEIWRLSPIDSLSADESALLSRILIKHFIGRRVGYDMGGALLSGTRLFQMSKLFPAIDPNKVFCSALVANVLQRLGRMNRTNSRRWNPARLLRTLYRQSTYQFCKEVVG